MKVRNSYQKSTIAEAVQINEEKDEMEKPHFLAQDPDHGSGHCGILSGICLSTEWMIRRAMFISRLPSSMRTTARFTWLIRSAVWLHAAA